MPSRPSTPSSRSSSSSGSPSAAAPSTSLRRLRVRAAALIAAVSVLSAAVAVAVQHDPATGTRDAAARSTTIDAYASYEPQRTCVAAALPGTVKLASYLQNTYRGTGSMGMMRGCTVGGSSEHKDGRAFDWAVDVSSTQQAAAAAAFVEAVTATDAAGNPHALARRMGLMYWIFDDKIYSSYNGFAPRPYLHSACKSLKTCDRNLRHLNHMHISLSKAGGSGQTSFYRNRGVKAVPVLVAGTRQLDADANQLTSLDVPANSVQTTTPFNLTGGRTYRLVVSGLVRHGAGAAVSDAVCEYRSDTADASGTWIPADSTRGLLVAGKRLFGTSCASDHTYEAWYTPTRTGPATFRVADDTPGDNREALRVHFARADVDAAALRLSYPAPVNPEPRAWKIDRLGPSTDRTRAMTKETVVVSARAKWGAQSAGAVIAGRRYAVTVSGEAASAGTAFDAACVRYAGRYRAQHSLDVRDPRADHLGLYLAGAKLNLKPVDAAGACSPTHRYTATFVAPFSGRVAMRTWDRYTYADNTGALTAQMRLLPAA